MTHRNFRKFSVAIKYIAFTYLLHYTNNLQWNFFFYVIKIITYFSYFYMYKNWNK